MSWKVLQEQKWLQWLLLILIAITLASALVLFVLSIWKKFLGTSQNMVNDTLGIINVIVLSLTALVALCVYKTNSKIENVKGLQELRKILNSEENMKVHQILCETADERKINSGKRNFEVQQKFVSIEQYYEENEQLVDNYLGTLELAKIYIDEGIIDKLSFYNQFGYRIENIKPIMEKLRNAEDAYLWVDLFRLYEMMPQLKSKALNQFSKHIINKK